MSQTQQDLTGQSMPRRRPDASSAVHERATSDQGPEAPVLIRLPDLSSAESTAQKKRSNPHLPAEGASAEGAAGGRGASRERRKSRARREESKVKASRWRIGSQMLNKTMLPLGWVGFVVVLIAVSMLIFRGDPGGPETPQDSWSASSYKIENQASTPYAPGDSQPQQAAHFSTAPPPAAPNAASPPPPSENPTTAGAQPPYAEVARRPGASPSPPTYTEGQFEDPWTPADLSDESAPVNGNPEANGALSPSVNPVPRESGVQLNGVQYERH